MANNAHQDFMSEIVKRAEADEAVSSQALAQVGVLKKKLAVEDECNAISRKNLLSDKINAADKLRDKYYLSLKTAIKSYLDMPEGEMKEAATVLWQCLKDYNVKVSDKLIDETGKLTNITTDFEGKYAEQVALLNLSPFLSNMKAANEEVSSLKYERTTEDSQKVAGALKAARAACDEAYKNLVMRVNALFITDSEHDYNAFIDALNEQIDKYRLSSKTYKKSDSDTTTTTTTTTTSTTTAE